MTDLLCSTARYSGEGVLDSKGVLLRTAGLMATNGALLMVITPFALLREDPLFWRNAGGWPTWLRELVLDTFYPLFAGEVSVLLVLSLLVFCSPTLARWRKHTWTLTGMMWLWMVTITVVVVSNNITNLWAGRPLHWHPM